MTHRNIWTDDAMTFGFHAGVTDRDVYLHTLPMFPRQRLGNAVCGGGPRHHPDCAAQDRGAEILRRVEKHGVTFMCAAPVEETLLPEPSCIATDDQGLMRQLSGSDWASFVRTPLSLWLPRQRRRPRSRQRVDEQRIWGDGTSKLTGGYVGFTPGARTNWHSHRNGQLLVCPEGVGLVGTRDGKTVLICAGESIWKPAGDEHFYGGTADNIMCHYAILDGSGDGGATTWLEPVTKGVILACGGFEWNEDYKRAFLRGRLTHPLGVKTNTGDCLYMAMKAGAMLSNMREASWAPAAELPPGCNAMNRSLVNVERSRPRSIMVNRRGCRFTNEAVNYTALGGAFHTDDVNAFDYANLPCWLIFDQEHLRNYGTIGAHPPGEVPPDWLTAYPTLRELAAGVGIDAENLVHTIERWNQQVAEGTTRTMGGAAARTTDGGAIHTSRATSAGLWDRSSARRSMRFASTAALSAQKVARVSTHVHGCLTSTGRSFPVCTPPET